jgi:CheY-like chemotaxis protein
MDAMTDYERIAAYGSISANDDGRDCPLALVVEDHDLNRELLCDILSPEFQVAEAATAEAAFQWLAKHHPSLILMDLQLPGMDGLTLVRRIKQNPDLATIPVVAVSAHALPAYIQRALEAGCIDFVTKPIMEDPDGFASRMRTLAVAS